MAMTLDLLGLQLDSPLAYPAAKNFRPPSWPPPADWAPVVDAEGNTVNSNADIRKDLPPPGGQFLFAPMPYWMRLTWNGVGMHAGPIPHPGTPASHGCIRLPDEMAQRLFEIVKIGGPVEIVR